MGAGGAIVAVPAFVYVGGIAPPLASGYALFVVAVATAVGSAQNLRKGLVHKRAFIAFGATSTVIIYSIRRWILPSFGQSVQIGGLHIATNDLLMIAFGVVLLLAGTAMLRHTLPAQATETHPAVLAATGAGIGCIAGFLGVGGGFLMTPALVMYARLDMRSAIATSLALICVNSAVGVGGDLMGGVQYDWTLLVVFTALTTIGVVVGMALANRFHPDHLKKIFGWLVATLGLAVLITEVRSSF